MSKGTFKHVQGLDGDQKRTATRHDYPNVFRGDRAPTHTMISEGGLYDKVLSAHKVNPKAHEFRKWVADVVLPAIRKDGAYIMGEEKVATGEMSEDELILKAVGILQRKVERLTAERDALAGGPSNRN
ncbi:BRO family protein [Magnetospirillum sp. 64-120]|uniref:BRO family protein n=1 Tax=Magnetospirillum sp. 64-120 TaxID=1895778 RepID=UPI00092ACC1F|nr:BRO family protein [Magnetospirillum sp. 64-120]OJX71744.1 MAG: hypothetical protein BGO92_03875 [Magnetospirillum sp. 64-120]